MTVDSEKPLDPGGEANRVRRHALCARSLSDVWTILGLTVVVAALGLGPLEAQPDPKGVTQAIRQIVEQGLDQEKGRELSSFSCSLPDFTGPPRVFSCQGTDDQGDRYEYLMAPTDDRDIEIALVSEPPEQVAPEFLAGLDAPCRAFLDDYASQQWSDLWSKLHPALQEIVNPTSLEEMLGSLRSQLGEPRSPSLSAYGIRKGGRYELQYNVPGEEALATLRCGLHLEDGGPQVSAFLLTPAWGTLLYAQRISDEAAEVLSSILGVKVARVEIPFEALTEQYDVAQGRAWLESGVEFAVQVEHTGRDDDFDRIDFQLKPLDVPLLVTRHLKSQGMVPKAFDCPSRVIPDGGSMDCTVQLEDGGSAELTVARRGGEHRILRLERVP
ncbi:MAG: hypothetical protein K8J08_18110 [Thermoanaerobaculia bacterium]|nr:hypothetical protein [Thermoanaerobaculia bacterium]